MENDIGLNKIDKKDLLIVFFLLILSIPLSFVASKIPEIKNFYLNYPLTPIGIFERLFGMFVLELIFRGFVMIGLFKRFGKWSIVLQDVPYTILHIGKPLLELPYSGVVGLIYGTIDYRSKSFLPSFLLHAIGSEIFIIMVHLL